MSDPVVSILSVCGMIVGVPLALVSPVIFTSILLVLFSVLKLYMDAPIMVILGGTVISGDLVLVVLGITLALRLTAGLKIYSLPKGIRGAIFIFVVYGIISIIRGVIAFGPPGLGEARRNLLFIVMALYVCFSLRRLPEAVRLMRLIYGLAVLVALVTVVATGWQSLAAGQYMRVFPATVGLLIAFGCIVATAGLWQVKKAGLSGVGSPIMITFLVVALIVSGHRSAWVGALAGISGLVVLPKSSRSVRRLGRVAMRLATVVVILIAGIGMVYGMTPNRTVESFKDERLAFVTEGYEEDYSANWRVMAWLEEYKRIRRRPVFGSGFGNRLRLQLTEHNEEWRSLPSHSGHLEILSRQGIFGYALFIGLVLTVMGYLAKKGRKEEETQFLGLTMTGLLITCLAFSLFYSFEFHFWLSLGLCLAVIRLCGESREVARTMVR